MFWKRSRHVSQKVKIPLKNKKLKLASASFASAVVAAVFFVSISAEAATGCTSIIHRAHSKIYVEETIPAIKQASKWKFGAELDARMTSDCAVVMVHDNTIKRITNYKYDWKPEEHTLAELRAITLPDGNKIATVKEAIRTAKQDGARQMIEIKSWQDYGDRWQECGLDVIDGWLSQYGMYDKVYLGSAGSNKYIKDNYPNWQRFYRADPDDTPTKEYVQEQGYKLVELDENVYSYARQLKQLSGVVVASRNVQNNAEIKKAYDAGLRVFQTNYGGVVNKYCKSRQ